MTLGENLQRLRAAKGLSQEEVARALHISRQSVSKWENNAAEPGVDHLRALARLYGVTLDELLGEDGEAAPPPGDGGGAEDLEELELGDGYYKIFTCFKLVGGVMWTIGWMTSNQLWFPWSDVAVLVGLWVRYPAMWVVLVCLHALDILRLAASLPYYGPIPMFFVLLLDVIYLWVLCRPAVRRRFQMGRLG